IRDFHVTGVQTCALPICIGESSVEEALGELVRSTAPTVATYAKNDGVHVRITDKGDDVAAVMARIEGMDALIRGRVGEYVWGAEIGRAAGRGRVEGWVGV